MIAEGIVVVHGRRGQRVPHSGFLVALPAVDGRKKALSE
jgi:hypothetical protein